ncbi:hypothetical protein CEUSTIGMA_g8109.t1 [Chlamydomonas eustigma]|uniref:Uncharacterized protein n=1 Tax=Chlamydomonas eustigma TaxID=1157962 RepID=A0A250XC64_9CHLO|nr:hypothetical protein CEUSTIGMA_g8109.t1 [Chlamydomonas eustigma]|eukprot:GAX80674.1 hypothetical protein CEUSTIGMA_g8109.t1 [Chlamydomonas eustigma]
MVDNLDFGKDILNPYNRPNYWAPWGEDVGSISQNGSIVLIGPWQVRNPVFGGTHVDDILYSLIKIMFFAALRSIRSSSFAHQLEQGPGIDLPFTLLCSYYSSYYAQGPLVDLV